MRGFKKRMLACFLVAAMVLTLGGFSSISVQAAKSVKAKKITMSKKSYTVEKGKKITIKATITPKKSTQKTIIWTSSDKKIATVNKKGVATGKKVGTTKITATIKGTKIKVTRKLKVVKAKIKVASVSLTSAALSLTSGQVFPLVATVNPSNASNKSIIWASSNTAVASVVNGTVTAGNTGQAVITATAKDSGVASTCTITVSNPANGLSLPITTSTLFVNQELLLTPSLTPANADNPGYVWTTTNPAIVTVATGNLTAHSPGIATITCTSADGKFAATCAVTVPSTYGVLDIQGVSDGDNIISYFDYMHNTSIGYIELYGYDPSLSSNFAITVADGVTYKIIPLEDSYYSKKIILSYKNLTKVYYVLYDEISESSSYGNPILASISDTNNIFTKQRISQTYSTSEKGKIYLYGVAPALSSNFVLTPKSGYSIKSVLADTDVDTSLAMTITFSKENIDYTYDLYYTQNNFKAYISSATDGTNTITDIDRSSYIESETYLTIIGTAPSLSTNFALKLEDGATYTLSDDPTLTYDKLATVTYGSLVSVYNITYVQDNRSASIISVSDPGSVITTTIISNSNANVGYIYVYSDSNTLSPQFSAIVADGCTYTISTPTSGSYERIITVTYGSLQRIYYVEIY